jgi:uncharacterized OsmC-like protein
MDPSPNGRLIRRSRSSEDEREVRHNQVTTLTAVEEGAMSKFVFEITLRRVGDHVVEAIGGTDGRVVMGPKGTPNSFTPVELLLAAIAGCSGVDLCTLSERDGIEVGEFELRVRGEKPIGTTRLSNIAVTYVVPQADPDVVAPLVVEVSGLCTVALTVSEGCPVEHVLAGPDGADGARATDSDGSRSRDGLEL